MLLKLQAMDHLLAICQASLVARCLLKYVVVKGDLLRLGTLTPKRLG